MKNALSMFLHHIFLSILEMQKKGNYISKNVLIKSSQAQKPKPLCDVSSSLRCALNNKNAMIDLEFHHVQ